jgi:hypothetical protein
MHRSVQSLWKITSLLVFCILQPNFVRVSAGECPTGFLSSSASANASCFIFAETRVSFGQAQGACAALSPSARVARITSRADENLIRSKVCRHPSGCWLSLRRLHRCTYSNATSCGGDTACACAFGWTDLRNISANSTAQAPTVRPSGMFWEEGRPKWVRTACVAASSQGWRDVHCSGLRPTVCEGKVASLTLGKNHNPCARLNIAYAYHMVGKTKPVSLSHTGQHQEAIEIALRASTYMYAMFLSVEQCP